MIRIPGKAMICGEYGVLHGGRALLAPVSRCLLVEEQPCAAPALPRGPVIAAALREPILRLAAFERECGLPNPHMDDRELRAPRGSGPDVKLGLGSSAAECVGIIALRFERAGLRWEAHRDEVLRHAMAAHERAQGGRGSGADVAVCAHGRPIDFRRAADGLEIRPWSPPVAMTLVWTGCSADTRSRIDRWAAYLSTGGQAAARGLAALIAAGDCLADCLSAAGPAPRWRDSLEAYIEQIGSVMRAAGIDYFPPGFESLDAWARRYDARVKPCGAGGGDMLLLLGDIPEDAFAAAPGAPRLRVALNG